MSTRNVTPDERASLERIARDRVDWICEACGSFGYGIHRHSDCARSQLTRNGVKP